MRILQIQDGISVNIDKIEGIEQIDKGGCKVYIGDNVFRSTYPYETLVQLIRNDSMINKDVDEGTKMGKVMEKLDKVLNKSQYWAG